MAEKTEQESPKSSLSVISIVVLVLFLAVVFFLYSWVSKKNKGEVVFPSGINYTGNETSPAPPQPLRPTYDWDKLGGSSDWANFTSPKGQYTFQYPKGIIPLIFPGDANDSVTFDVSNIPAQFNLMGLMERVSNYDKKMVGDQESFVNNYWRFFGGLKGVNKAEEFTNEKGLKGWKASYVNKSNVVTSDNYFLVVPGDDDRILHIGNVFPAEGQAVFLRILNTVDLKK